MDGKESCRLDSRENKPPIARNQRVARPALIGFYFAKCAPGASDGGIAGRTSGVQKKLSATVASLQEQFGGEKVEVWCQDEARLGLQPVLRRVWAKRGRRPNAKVEPRYQWLWVYAAVHPRKGTVFWLILPFLNAACVELFLTEFARTHLSEGKRIVLVWDGAPAHRAKSLRVPEGITLLNFPAYTPQLNPSERLWSAVKEGIANEWQENIEKLEEKIVARCQKISAKPEQVKSLTSYHWWSYA